MKEICNNCKHWSRSHHHPTSKWWWFCNHKTNSKKKEYTPYNGGCKHWESVEK